MTRSAYRLICVALCTSCSADKFEEPAERDFGIEVFQIQYQQVALCEMYLEVSKSLRQSASFEHCAQKRDHSWESPLTSISDYLFGSKAKGILDTRIAVYTLAMEAHNLRSSLLSVKRLTPFLELQICSNP